MHGGGGGWRCEGRGWGLGCDRRLRRRCRRGWRSRCTLDPPGRGLAPLEAVNRRARRLTALGARGTPGRVAGGARCRGGGVGVRLRLRGRREGCGGETGCAAETGCAGAGSGASGCADAGVAGLPSRRASRRGRTGSRSGGRVGAEPVGGSVEVRATWFDRAWVTTSRRGSVGLGRAVGAGCEGGSGALVGEGVISVRGGVLATGVGSADVAVGGEAGSSLGVRSRRTRDSARRRSPGRASAGAAVGAASVGDAGVGDTAAGDAAVGSGWAGG